VNYCEKNERNRTAFAATGNEHIFVSLEPRKRVRWLHMFSVRFGELTAASPDPYLRRHFETEERKGKGKEERGKERDGRTGENTH